VSEKWTYMGHDVDNIVGFIIFYFSKIFKKDRREHIYKIVGSAEELIQLSRVLQA